MLPDKHIFYGGIFALASWIIIPTITIFSTALIFLSSFLIDVDHYIWYGINKKDWSLKRAYDYLKGCEEEKTLMIFHTVEFIILIGLLGIIWSGFYYILIGILFHSVLDITELAQERRLKVREFFLTRWIIRKLH